MVDNYFVCDIETTGLHRKKDSITLFGGYLPQSKKFMQIENPTKAKFKKIKRYIEANNLKVVWHNSVFDVSFIAAQTGVYLPIDEDSMLIQHILDSNKKNGLKYIATEELHLPDWDIDLDTKKGNGSIESLKEYHKYDLTNTWEVFKWKRTQLKAASKEQRKLYYDLMIPGARAIAQMQVNGIWFDVEQARIEQEDYQKKLDTTLAYLYDLVPKKFSKMLHDEKILKKEDDRFNFNSSKQLGLLFDYLEFPILDKTPSGARATSAEAIHNLNKNVEHPLLDALSEYRNITKNLTFLDKWLELEYKGRLYPSFNLTGTKTGRLSSSEPNLQQVPRNPKLRTLFHNYKNANGKIAKLVECDFSQVELRIAAHITKEKNMLAAYNRGEDLHTNTARIFNDPPTKEDRTNAKAMNFGLLYGMQAKSYRDYADTTYGVSLTDGEARKNRKDFFRLYPGLPKYHKKIENHVKAKQEYMTEFGRIRKFPEAKSRNKYKASAAVRTAINYPVQSTASDLLLSCIIELYENHPEIKLVGTVHDSILVEVTKKSQLSDIKAVMQHPYKLDQFKINLEVPLEADIELGPWGSPTHALIDGAVKRL